MLVGAKSQIDKKQEARGISNTLALFKNLDINLTTAGDVWIASNVLFTFSKLSTCILSCQTPLSQEPTLILPVCRFKNSLRFCQSRSIPQYCYPSKTEQETMYILPNIYVKLSQSRDLLATRKASFDMAISPQRLSKSALGGTRRTFSGPSSSESTRNTIVDVFMVLAMQSYKADMFLAQQEHMSGRRGHGPVDFTVLDRKHQTQVLGVTEVKKDDHVQGLAQNMVQLDTAMLSSGCSWSARR
ncbi:hypothetical protein B0O80DRAFT_497023 [Mortierella sp. GBAus27b]|nr:hypothetical protein B0O80DRAFT_497023 [Mortierella sp. GBAus27b]